MFYRFYSDVLWSSTSTRDMIAILIAASRAQVPQTQVIETLRQVPALEYQEVVKQALWDLLVGEGDGFWQRRQRWDLWSFKALLNHDLKYRKCRMWWWWWWWWWWCGCVGGFVFTTMCKLPRIPPWKRCFSLKMYQEEQLNRKWFIYSRHSVAIQWWIYWPPRINLAILSPSLRSLHKHKEMPFSHALLNLYI